MPELKKKKPNKHIHQKPRKARALSESLVLLLMYSYTDFAFEDVLNYFLFDAGRTDAFASLSDALNLCWMSGTDSMWYLGKRNLTNYSPRKMFITQAFTDSNN